MKHLSLSLAPLSLSIIHNAWCTRTRTRRHHTGGVSLDEREENVCEERRERRREPPTRARLLLLLFLSLSLSLLLLLLLHRDTAAGGARLDGLMSGSLRRLQVRCF